MRYPTRLRSIPWLLTVGIAIPGACLPASAQEPATKAEEKPAEKPVEPPKDAGVNQLAALRNFPSSYKLNELNSKWRRFTLNDANDNNSDNATMRMAANMRLLERFGIGVYYTKGDSVVMGKESFLVAYRIDQELTQREMQTAMQSIWGHGHGNPDSGNDKFLPNTKLTLTLLNLHSSGSLNDVVKFDPATEIMGPADITAASTANLRRLGQTLQQISQYQPLPLKDIKTMRTSLQNQMHDNNDRPFMHPLTQEPYRPNTKVAGKRSTQIANRKVIPAIYEAKPGTDKKRGVVFVDGHVERVPEANWAKMIAQAPRGPSAKEIHEISAKRLRRMNSLLVMIAQNSNGNLPNMSDARSIRRTLQNWGGYEPDLYTHPKSEKPFAVNAAISNKKLSNISNRKSVVSFYESTPGSDNQRGVVFLDGHTQRIPEKRFKSVLAVSARMSASKKN